MWSSTSPAAAVAAHASLAVLAAVLTAAVAGCSGDEAATVDGVEVPDGYEVTLIADGLDRPTQLTPGPDGSLLVAQLNGAEGEESGQVLRLDPGDSAERTVLFDGLVTPTGVVAIGSDVWVMEQRRLSRGAVTGGNLEVVFDELPYNDRSEGTLSVDEQGRLLYNTSGSVDGVEAAEGSGVLWALAPGSEPEPLATGFKHAYARTFDDEGTLWQTEVSDGTYDGQPPPDELVAVEPGDDFGWPQCIGDRQPVESYEGTQERCADTPRPQALFAPGATPTSVAVAPWDPDVLLVALWNERRIVTVDRTRGDGPVRPETFLTGIERPQHLLADGERLLITDFEDGRLLAVTAAEG
ncbi:MAG: PQQ-dependent sugar dehydrogenase [Acidimicrobiia bacterium]|nr:PQQ-dependent sugar dehydrogenase [Acidimicrobiia bacterium]